MVLVVKKLVPVYKTGDDVPRQYLNLRKAVYVTTFKYAYRNIPQILEEQYGLKPDDKIVVFWTKNVPRRNFEGYRLPFKKIYSGQLTKFAAHLNKIRRHD